MLVGLFFSAKSGCGTTRAAYDAGVGTEAVYGSVECWGIHQCVSKADVEPVGSIVVGLCGFV